MPINFTHCKPSQTSWVVGEGGGGVYCARSSSLSLMNWPRNKYRDAVSYIVKVRLRAKLSL